jgi:hypothetical protein
MGWNMRHKAKMKRSRQHPQVSTTTGGRSNMNRLGGHQLMIQTRKDFTDKTEAGNAPLKPVVAIFNDRERHPITACITAT